MDDLDNPSSATTNTPQLEVWEGSSAHVQQGRHWSSALIWIFTALFGGTLLWAFTAKLDQTVVAPGRLEPSESIREIDSPSTGVVSKVFVDDSESVDAGDRLFTVEAKGLISRRKAIQSMLVLIDLQSRSIESILRSDGNPDKFDPLPTLEQVQDPELAAKMLTTRQQVVQLRSSLQQLQTRLNSRRKTKLLLKQIIADLKPLYETGAMARNQYLTEANKIQEINAELASLEAEQSRKLGEAATQLDTLNKQALQMNAQLESLKENIAYRTVLAPISGRVFDTKISKSSVVNSDQVVMRLVPSGKLQASINISDRDIGFVKKGMSVNVSVDSFPSGEYGYIKGTISDLGSDVLSPDSKYNIYRFPATVTLNEQRGQSYSQDLNLQSGMSVSAIVKLRTRPAIHVITDLFTKQMEGVQRFR